MAERDPDSDATAANASVGDRAAARAAILAGAARWLGVDVHEPIETIRALADVDRRPNPKRFETLILSARDGRARMHQSAGMHAGLHPSGPWLEIPGDNLTRDLPEETQPMVQGHELHTAILMPHARYTHPTYLGETPFGATEALEVQNQWGGSVSLFCSQQDTMLFGMRMAKTGEVQLADWESRNGLQIFRSATFTTPSTSTTTPTGS